jgi:hypothetical protein
MMIPSVSLPPQSGHSSRLVACPVPVDRQARNVPPPACGKPLSRQQTSAVLEQACEATSSAVAVTGFPQARRVVENPRLQAPILEESEVVRSTGATRNSPCGKPLSQQRDRWDMERLNRQCLDDQRSRVSHRASSGFPTTLVLPPGCTTTTATPCFLCDGLFLFLILSDFWIECWRVLTHNS